MRPVTQLHRCVGLAAALSVGWSCASAADAPATGDVVSGTWQHHKLTFHYVGFTTLYTCNGLEEHVRSILLYLGARKDLTVSATGCAGPDYTPTHSAFVNTQFYTLAPSTDASQSNAVKARWGALTIEPRRPSFMGDGDCELIEAMKDLITNNFSLRDVNYRTDCVPRQLLPDGYAVEGQTLRAAPPIPTAAKN
jgi:hypothetical protein